MAAMRESRITRTLRRICRNTAVVFIKIHLEQYVNQVSLVTGLGLVLELQLARRRAVVEFAAAHIDGQ